MIWFCFHCFQLKFLEHRKAATSQVAIVCQVLMLIHFLQRRDPPILPSLQVRIRLVWTWLNRSLSFLGSGSQRCGNISYFQQLSCLIRTRCVRHRWSQDMAFSQNQKARYINGVDCRLGTEFHHFECGCGSTKKTPRFCTDPAQIEKEMAYLRGSREPNKDCFGMFWA